MKKLDAVTIERILERAAKNLSIAEKAKLEKFKIIEIIRDEWAKIVPVILSEHSFPKDLQETKLLIATDHPIYAQEILAHQNIILKRINELTGLNISTMKTVIDKRLWSHQRKKKSDIILEKQNLVHTADSPTQEEREIQLYLKNLSEEIKKQR